MGKQVFFATAEKNFPAPADAKSPNRWTGKGFRVSEKYQ